MLAAALLLLGLAAALLVSPDLDRSALEARFADSQADFISVDGMRLHVQDSGPRGAPAIILLPDGYASPGFACEEAGAASLAAVAAFLAG